MGIIIVFSRKMKLTSAVVISAVAAQRGVGGPGGVRRYFQLTEMMENYNADFDERQYWAYGCNCFILGDRPMSDPGHGPPVDSLDAVCKAYKDCVKCAKMEHGDACIG